MNTHEDTSSTLGIRALTTQTLDLAICIDLVVLQDGHLDLLALMLHLLGSVVRLLFALLGTTTEAEHQVESRLLLNVIVAEGAAILELLSGEDQTLLVRWDTGELSDYDDEPVKPSHSPLLVLDLGLDIVDRVRRLDL